MKISNRLQQFQLESQTVPLKNASVFRKILALVYQLLGRKMIAKLLISSNKCNACNCCVSICPNNAIKLRLKNPRRDNQCKGCLLCLYSCPKQAFEIPVCSLLGAFLLLFLPYDEWIIRLFSLKITLNRMSIIYMLVSLLLWAIGYAIAVFLLDKVVFLSSTLSVFKRIGEIQVIKKMRNKLNPALIFPIILPMHLNDPKDSRM